MSNAPPAPVSTLTALIQRLEGEIARRRWVSPLRVMFLHFLIALEKLFITLAERHAAGLLLPEPAGSEAAPLPRQIAKPPRKAAAASARRRRPGPRPAPMAAIPCATGTLTPRPAPEHRPTLSAAGQPHPPHIRLNFQKSLWRPKHLHAHFVPHT